MRRIWTLTVASALGCGLLLPSAYADPPAPLPAAAPNLSWMLSSTAQSLYNRHIAVTTAGGGARCAAPAGNACWAWQSVIQSPNLQTDRDVGAASVGMGLLAMWQQTGSSAYLTAAENAGYWLLQVAQPANGGLRWPDYNNGGSAVSSTHFTSFDDGAPGIADFLWQLGKAAGGTMQTTFQNAAAQAMVWEESQAIPVTSGAGCSTSTPCYYWHWTDTPGDTTTYTGMGTGVAGIAWAFNAFYLRTGNPTYRAYADAAAQWLHDQITAQGAMPESPAPASPGYDTGFLWGSAGAAFMFLTLHQDTPPDPNAATWLNDAQRLLAWVGTQEVGAPSSPTGAWPIEPGLDSTQATGIEEGSAGIGWVALQAYRLTSSSGYLAMARRAGSWLHAQAQSAAGGLRWPEDAGIKLVHTSLDNGAPGIGWFLNDLYRADATQTQANADAQAAEQWLAGTYVTDPLGIYWYENCKGDKACKLAADPSWHWGLSGIDGFFSRLSGWPVDSPGEEPGLPFSG